MPVPGSLSAKLATVWQSRLCQVQMRIAACLCCHRRPPQSYFRARATLPRTYWLSATRNASGGDFAWPDGAPIPSNISTTVYSHWYGAAQAPRTRSHYSLACRTDLVAPSCARGQLLHPLPLLLDYPWRPPCTGPAPRRAWYYPFTRTTQGYDCVHAASDLAYDVYLGTDARDDYVNSLNYLANEANKQGWNLATCGLRFAYICEAPAAAFPCYPPPSPPGPPPSPPSPPFPPMPPNCEHSLVGLPGCCLGLPLPACTVTGHKRGTQREWALWHIQLHPAPTCQPSGQHLL